MPADQRREDSGAVRTSERIALALVCVLHAALGLAAVPNWLFAKYPHAAHLLSERRLTADSGGDFSPAYLMLNSALSPEAVRLVQILAGSLCVLAVFALARRFFGRAAAFAAALTFALAAPVVLYESTLEPDLLIAVLDCAAVAVVATAAVPFAPGPALAGGALLGLSVGLRPTALLVALAVALAMAVRGARLGQPRPAARAVALLLATAVAIGFAPTFAVRAAAGSEPFATMSVGAVMQMGNRPEGTGLGTAPPVLLKLLEAQQQSVERPDSAHALYRRFARADAGESLSATGAELYWIRKTLAFAAREPLAFAGLLARKLQFALVGPDGHDLVDVRRADASLARWPLPRAGLLGLLGLLGLVAALIRRRVDAVTLFAFAALCALDLLFYVVSRYRLALIPFFCVFAGSLVATARDAVRERPARVALALAGAAAGLFALWSRPVLGSAHNLARLDAASDASAAFARATRSGDLDAATRAFVEVHAAAPYGVLVQDLRGIPFERAELRDAAAEQSARAFGTESDSDAFALASLAVESGHCERALPVLEQLGAAGFRQAIFDRPLDPDLLRAQCLLEAHRPNEALGAVRQSLERHPGTAEGLSLAIAGSLAIGRVAAAAAPFADELAALHDPLSAAYALARAHLDWGGFAAALERTDQLLAELPESAEAHYVRARALLGLRRDAEALAEYDLALRLFPRHGFETEPFEPLVRSALADVTPAAEVLSLAAEHRLRRGEYREARALAAEASRQFGSAAPDYHRERASFLARIRGGGLDTAAAD